MFSRASSVFVLALPLFAAASILPRTDGPSNQCNTGPIQCCNSAVAPTDPTVALLLGLLGINIGSLTGLVGLTCSPISVIGVGSSSCTAQPVCCTDNSFSGVVALGCTAITL